MKKLFTIFCIFSILALSACGNGTTRNVDLSGNGSSGENNSSEEIVDETIPEISDNPVVETQFFGSNGNLWKPSGDAHASGAGNLAILLSSSFRDQFDSCKLKKTSGETVDLLCLNTVPWTQIPYSCFSNGNRQTWRANFKCNEAAEVKVTCYEDKQEVVFTVPEAQRGAVCSRFG
ncbi:MAG: hypothetical protein R3A13_04270 [Bdellovibrionota bacterium]